MTEQFTMLLSALREFGVQLVELVPRVAVAVLLLTAGWVLARVLRRLTIRGLRLARVDVAAERAGIEDFLIQGGVRLTAVSLVGHLVYWGVNLVVVLAALSVFGLRSTTELFHRFVLYLPNVVAAVVVLIAGSLFAQFVGTLVRTYLANLRVAGADVIAAIARWALIVFVVSLGMEQLSIGGQILVSAFQIAFGAFCLALALAFGLGGRDWAARVLSTLLDKR